MKDGDKNDKRARARALASEFAARGDSLGWFDELYKESSGDNGLIPWADLEPNQFFKSWAERNGLTGGGRKALVVGCGLGDDAAYLDDLGFKVTAFDISQTAIEWARRLHEDRDIQFEVADLFSPPAAWRCEEPVAATGGTSSRGGFDFVLEVYTIQPLPMEMRPQVIDAIAAFAAPKGELVVICHGRDESDEAVELPWPLSRNDLSRFGANGLVQTDFEDLLEEDEGELKRRFVAVYRRP